MSMDNMDNEKLPKSSQVFFTCKHCDYSTSKLSNWNKHLTTLKHRRITMDNKSSQKVAGLCDETIKRFICGCGKTYKYKSGLCKHKKICLHGEINNELNKVKNAVNEQIDKDALILELFKKMDEKEIKKRRLLGEISYLVNHFAEKKLIMPFQKKIGHYFYTYFFVR